jgi:hypothetical protein
MPGGAGGGGQPARAVLVGGAQLRRLFERRRRGGVAGAPQRLGGPAFQVGGDGLVGPVGGAGSVPGAPLRLPVAQGRGQRLVRRPACGPLCAVIDHRAHQGMRKVERRLLDTHQVGQRRRLQQVRVQAEPFGGAADDGEPACALGGR